MTENQPMKITEPMMFRAVVIVGIAMVPVILLAALIDPLAGAILFGLEAGAGAVYLTRKWREAKAQRRDLPPEAPESSSAPDAPAAPEPTSSDAPPVDAIK